MSDGRRTWFKCRRGTRELDLLLERFFRLRYAQLSAHEQRVFETLLEQPDPLLTQWFQARSYPEDDELATLVRDIRECARR